MSQPKFSQSISSLSQIPEILRDYRCPECSLIPFIEISSNDNKLTMKTKCTNNHTFVDNFDKMQMKCRTQKSKYFCEICRNANKKNEFEQENLYYCSKCYKFFCYNHGKNIHKLKEGHNIYFNECYDNICFEHNGTSVIGYCSNCNKNYCKRCTHFNENNKNVDEELNEQQIQEYEKEIKNNQNIINEIDLLFKNYKKTFIELEQNYNLYKQNMIKKINFIKELVTDYKNKLSKSALNYQMKANIKVNHFNLAQINQKINDKITSQIKEINKIIKLFKEKDEPNKY